MCIRDRVDGAGVDAHDLRRLANNEVQRRVEVERGTERAGNLSQGSEGARAGGAKSGWLGGHERPLYD